MGCAASSPVLPPEAAPVDGGLPAAAVLQAKTGQSAFLNSNRPVGFLWQIALQYEVLVCIWPMLSVSVAGTKQEGGAGAVGGPAKVVPAEDEAPVGTIKAVQSQETAAPAASGAAAKSRNTRARRLSYVAPNADGGAAEAGMGGPDLATVAISLFLAPTQVQGTSLAQVRAFDCLSPVCGSHA